MTLISVPDTEESSNRVCFSSKLPQLPLAAFMLWIVPSFRWMLVLQWTVIACVCINRQWNPSMTPTKTKILFGEKYRTKNRLSSRSTQDTIPTTPKDDDVRTTVGHRRIQTMEIEARSFHPYGNEGPYQDRSPSRNPNVLIADTSTQSWIQDVHTGSPASDPSWCGCHVTVS